MPPTPAKARPPRSTVSPHVGRFVDFAEPSSADDCLGLCHGDGPLPAALEPLVRRFTPFDPAHPASGGTGPQPAAAPAGRTPTVLFDRRRPGAAPTAAGAGALPYQDGAFTLVISHFSIQRLDDPARVLCEMVRVCRGGGKVIIAEQVRPARHASERDRLERLRDPGHRGLPSLEKLIALLTQAGARVRRLDRLNVERPLEPWLEAAADPQCAEAIRQALLEEVDGGPCTGARPRVIGGELWVTHTWAHLAAEPHGR